jgi:hypothetical protein
LERVTRLLAAPTHAGAAQVAPAPFDRGESFALYAHYAPLVAERLSPEEFKRCENEGRAMSVDEAIAYALGDDAA